MLLSGAEYEARQRRGLDDFKCLAGDREARKAHLIETSMVDGPGKSIDIT